MKTRMFIVIVLLVIVFGGIFGWKAFLGGKISEAIANQPIPAVTVTAAEAVDEVWKPTLSAVGSLQAIQGVSVTSEVAGIVSEIQFQSGDEVTKGDLLVTLDASVDLADLEGLKAQEELDKVELKRQSELAQTKSTSRSQLDAAQAQFDRSRAGMRSKMAMIAQKMIRAPFTGVLGIRRINLGEYLSPGAEIVTLQSLDPIYANFNLPQQELTRIKKGMGVEMTSDVFPGLTFKGSITAINSRVDERTRNVMVQATLANAGQLLRPGIFVRLSVVLPTQQDVITLPQTAITYNPYGSSVFLIQDKKQGDESQLVVSRVFVQSGVTRGDQVEIVKGVNAGDRVVTSGQLKLREGSTVTIDNSITPENQAVPQVENN